MLTDARFGTGGLVVLIAISGLIGTAVRWIFLGRTSLDQLTGAAQVLRAVQKELPADNPIRRRLESAPVSEISFEELAQLMASDPTKEAAARGLIALTRHVRWLERFGQVAIHMGILGTVAALITSDPSNLASFRGQLPLALGTTFWGIVGALTLSSLAGVADGIIDSAEQRVRNGLLKTFGITA